MRSPAHRSRMRAMALLVLWILACAGGLALLWTVTDPRFTSPPVDPSGWRSWWDARDPIDAAASLCRLAASLALAYLVLAAAVLLASGLLSTACVHRLAATLNPAPVAGLLTAAAVTAAPAAGASPAQVSGSGDGDAPRMELVQDLPTMTLLGSDDAGVASRPSSHPGPRPSGAGSRTAGDPASPAPPERQAAAAGTVVVRPGDNPWDIAARRMALALGRRPTDGEVRAYWKALLAANADRLVDPSDPGLILPGQELVLPG